MALLQEINKSFGITILLVTHDPAAAKYSSRMVLLSDGKIMDDLERNSLSNEQYLQEIYSRTRWGRVCIQNWFYEMYFRNLQTYTIYFFSLTLIYSLLYAFNALPSHPVMQSLSGAKEMLTTVMSQYMGLLSYLILSAIAFLIVYATNFVLGRRKKELGLYATLGMKKKQIIRTLFFETMLVNIFSLDSRFLAWSDLTGHSI